MDKRHHRRHRPTPRKTFTRQVCDPLERRILLSGDSAVLSLPLGTNGDPVAVALSSYSYGAQASVSLQSGGGSGAPAYSALTATTDLSAVSPVLFQTLVSGAAVPAGTTLTVYDPQGAPVLRDTLGTVFITADSPAVTLGQPAQESLSLQFASLTETPLTAAPTIAPAAGEQVLSFTPAGASSPTQLVLGTSGWSIQNSYSAGSGATGGSTGKASFSQYTATDSAFTPASATLLNDLVASANLGLVTVTDYGAGGTPTATYSMQDVLVSQLTTGASYAGNPPSDSFSLLFATMTVAYAPAVPASDSVSTWNALQNDSQPLSNFPAPPKGALRNGGGTPGASATTPTQLTVGTPNVSGSPTFGTLAIDSFSIPLSTSGGKAAAPLVQVTAPLGSDAPEWLLGTGTAPTYQTITLARLRGTTVYDQFTLGMAIVTAFSITSAGGTTEEHITFQEQTLTQSYTPENPNGTAGTPVVRGWNFTTSAATAGSGSYPAATVPHQDAAVLSFPTNGSNSAVQLQVDGYTFGASQAVTIGSGTGSMGAGKVTLADLSFTAQSNPFSPELLTLLTSQSVLQGITLTTYDASGTATVTYALKNATVATDAPSLSAGDPSPTDAFSLAYGSVTVTDAAKPAVPPAADTQTLSLGGTTLAIANSSWSLGGHLSAAAAFTTFTAASDTPGAVGALSTPLLAGTALPLVTVTDYDSAGAVADTYSMQQVYVTAVQSAYTRGGKLAPTVTFALAFATATEDFAPTTAPSVATWNVINGDNQPLPATPAPPTGTTVPGGGTPNLPAVSPLELDLGTPATTATVAVGPIALDSFSYGVSVVAASAASGGSVASKAAAPAFTIDAPLESDAPDWLADAGARGSFRSATLIQRDAAGDVIAQWTLGQVSVLSFGLTGSGQGLSGETEQITLSPVQLTEAYILPAPATTVSRSWDFNTDAILDTGNTGSPLATLAGPSDYLRLDPNGSNFDVWYATTPIGAPDLTVPRADLPTLALAPVVAGTATVTVDFSDGSPVPDGGLAVNGGYGQTALNLLVVGSTGNDSVGVSSTAVTVNSAAPITYGGLTGLAVNGNGGADTITQSAQPADPFSLTGNTALDSLVINGGSYNVPAPAAGTGVVVYNLGHLTVGSAGLFALGSAASAPADRTLLVTTAIVAAGSVDLGRNDVNLTGTTLAAATALVANGYAGGTWVGGGITSSAAALDPRHLAALGVIQNATASGSLLYPTFDGQPAAATAVLIRYTYYGDANLDGVVNGADYSRIDAGFISHLSGWCNGDFNYDGAVDGSDYTLIDNAFNQQSAAAPAAVVAVVPVARPAAVVTAAKPAAHRLTVVVPPPPQAIAPAVAADDRRKIKPLAYALNGLR